MADLKTDKARSGIFISVWTIVVQTLPEDTDRIPGAVLRVHSHSFGRYQRTVSSSSIRRERAQPGPNSTTTIYESGHQAGQRETYPMVELKISLERDLADLEKVMNSSIYAHPYKEPFRFLRED